MSKIFGEYTDDNFNFNKTKIIIKLTDGNYSELMSRSMAKRILNRVENFKEVIFDFEGINIVGQGFSDEIFCVFQNKYRDIKLNYINTCEKVEFMIKRAIARYKTLNE